MIRDSIAINWVDGSHFNFQPLILKGRYSQATFWLGDQKFQGKLEEGGFLKLAALIKYQDQRITELKSSVKEKIVIKEVKYIPLIYKVLSLLGLLLLMYFLVRLVLLVSKNLRV